MRPQFVLWAFEAVGVLILLWFKVPLSYAIEVVAAAVILDWIVDRWILRRKPVEPRQLLPNRRLLTAIICGTLGAAAGVGMGLFMQCDATTLLWLGILPGTVGFFFGLVFKMTA
jgi:hypothetical protein